MANTHEPITAVRPSMAFNLTRKINDTQNNKHKTDFQLNVKTNKHRQNTNLSYLSFGLVAVRALNRLILRSVEDKQLFCEKKK